MYLEKKNTFSGQIIHLFGLHILWMLFSFRKDKFYVDKKKKRNKIKLILSYKSRCVFIFRVRLNFFLSFSRAFIFIVTLFSEKTANNFIDAVKHSTNITTDVLNRKKFGSSEERKKNRKNENNIPNEKAYTLYIHTACSINV